MLQKIDVDKIFQTKNPGLYRLLPRFIFSFLKRIIHQDEVNSFLERNEHNYDFDFIKASIVEFGITEKVIGLENLPTTGGPVLVANHPLGAMDFMTMMNAIGMKRKDVKALVNDILLNLHNLRNLFAGVNKVGKSSAEALQEVESVFASTNLSITFPAGLVSRKQFPNGLLGKPVIEDLEWKKTFITRAKKHKKNVVPVYIEARNSNFFYSFALWRKRLGIKANIEMLFLVNEMYKQRGKTISVIFGEEIPYETFDKRFTDAQWAEKIKRHVYEMGRKKKSLKFKVEVKESPKPKDQRNSQYMKPVIAPIAKELLLKELTRERFVRDTNYGKNEIYVVTNNDSPNVLKEIGRLREVTFRAAGGGTGLDCDLDEFDTDKICYQQLIVWNPTDKEIVGGYRFILIRDADKDEKGFPKLSTSHYFKFSDKFVKDYAPYTIELGRSFVQPLYQPGSTNRKGLFSLDNLWDGLGAIYIDNPDQKYFFGKMTMYKDYNQHARDMLMYFLELYFPDPENLVVPYKPLGYTTDISEFKPLFKKDMPYKEAHAILNQSIRKLGENIPPLFNSYMNISPSMKTFGAADNLDFGGVEETGILVTIADIYPSKTERHITSYTPKKRV